jgi:hypothetical protein
MLREGFALSRIALLRLTLTLLVFGRFAAGASAQVTLNPNVLNVYRNSPAINLTQTIAANPPGGTYSGPGVTNNSFWQVGLPSGTHTITYTAPGGGTANLTVNISHAAPYVAAADVTVSSPNPISEGSDAAIGATISNVRDQFGNAITPTSGSVTTNGFFDSISAANLAQLANFGSTTITRNFRYNDDNPTGTPTDPTTLTVSVFLAPVDNPSLRFEATRQVSVANLPPSALEFTIPAVVPHSNNFGIFGSFVDGGLADTHTVTIDWGDGTTANIFPPDGVRAFNTTKQYPPTVGTARYNITVTITDDDTGSTSLTKPIDVIGYQESLVVTTAADELDITSDPSVGTGTSLREALRYAESKPGPDVVGFSSTLSGQTINLTQGWNGPSDDTALRVSGDVTIDGNNLVTLAIAGGTQRRHILAGGGAFRLEDITLRDGNLSSVQVGGALFLSASSTLNNVRFVNNRGTSGGAIFITNLSSTTVFDCRFENNTADSNGGAIDNAGGSLAIDASRFTGNSAFEGGAVQSSGSLTGNRSTFAGNSAGFNGGALRLLGTAEILTSTISGNTATNDGGGLISFGNATLSNVTLAGNQARAGGGAVFWENTAALRHVTIARNSATAFGGGTFVHVADVTLTSTLIAGNDAPAQPDTFGAAFNAASVGSVLNVSLPDAKLGPLADNGGSSETIALLPGSPAVDAAVPVGGFPVDQRLVARDAQPDAGAFEFLDFQPQLEVTTTADEDDGQSDPRFGSGTSLREAVRHAMRDLTTTGFGPATGSWSFNGSSTAVSGISGTLGHTLTLTPELNAQLGSAWRQSKVNVDRFTASFRYSATGTGFPLGEGFTFTLQNQGPSALGSAGGGLGYVGIPNSIAIAFLISSPGEIRMGIYYNGVLVRSFNPLAQGMSTNAPLDVTISRDGQRLDLTFFQNGSGYTQTLDGLDFATVVGALDAYAGFTAATSGLRARQQISQARITSPFVNPSVSFAPALAGQTIALSTAAGSADGWDTCSALSVTRNVTIDGPATSPGVTLGIDTGAALRHFVVRSGASLTLNNLTLRGGKPQLSSFNRGGAISAFGDFTARNCTFTGNTSPGEGGAIQNWPGAASLVLENCTFSGNSGGSQGGAFSTNGTQATMRHLTISNNTAPGSAVVLWGTQGTLVNTILAGNSNDTVLTGSGGTFTAQSTNNLLGASSATGLTNGSNGNQLGVPAASLLLGSPGNNGGPTQTIALLPGSPAVDAGVAIGGLMTDQRGTARPQGSGVDIGAFELVPSEPAAIPIVGPLGGTYPDSVQISINSTSTGTSVRYTLDGSTPSATNGFLYTAPFNLAQTATIKAIAYNGGWLPSPVASVGYTVLSPLPYWRNMHGLPADGSQDLATPAGDGVANLLKFAFNMAPNAGNLALLNSAPMPWDGTAGLPVLALDEQGRLVVQFVRRKAATNPGIAYIVETDEDLNNLMPLSLAGAAVVSIDATWERVTVTDPAITPKRFGRVRIQPLGVYFNDFNSALGAATLRGSAVWTNGAVKLTDETDGGFGAVTFDGITTGPQVSGFTARFHLALGPIASGVPADGASFAVGDLGTGPWTESGPATAHHLSVSFDTFNNGTGAQNDIGIHLRVNGVHLATNATNPYTDGAFVQVEITYQSGAITVKFNGAVIFDQVATSGFSFLSTDQFGLSARTGGAKERATVDNVEIAPR